MFVILSGALLTGELSGYEAKNLIKASLDGLNTLCNTIVLASATILALLLTLISFSSRSDSKLKEDYYRHISILAKLDTGVFIAAMITFLFFNIPITESDSVPDNWFSIIYYVSLGLSSILSAALIVVVIMLYNTVIQLIIMVSPGDSTPEFIMEEDSNREDA